MVCPKIYFIPPFLFYLNIVLSGLLNLYAPEYEYFIIIPKNKYKGN